MMDKDSPDGRYIAMRAHHVLAGRIGLLIRIGSSRRASRRLGVAFTLSFLLHP
jgi:hypothetical protein